MRFRGKAGRALTSISSLIVREAWKGRNGPRPPRHLSPSSTPQRRVTVSGLPFSNQISGILLRSPWNEIAAARPEFPVHRGARHGWGDRTAAGVAARPDDRATILNPTPQPHRSYYRRPGQERGGRFTGSFRARTPRSLFRNRPCGQRSIPPSTGPLSSGEPAFF